MTATRHPGNVGVLVAEAQARAGAVVASVLPSGPTKALLALYVARAEVLRIAKQHIPPDQWPAFLREQSRLERAFEEQCASVREVNAELLALTGNFVG